MNIERIGNAKIITSDNVTALKQFPDDFVDLTVTSPPYDTLRSYKGFEWDFESLAKELYRVTKPGGVVVWIVNDATISGSETGSSFRQALYFKDVCGFNLHDTMIWRKPNAPPQTKEGRRYTLSHEYMFIFTKGKVGTFNPIMEPCLTAGKKSGVGTNLKPDGSVRTDRVEARKDKVVNDMKQRYSVWDCSILTTNLGHPAAFPEALANDHILSWSNEGDVVLDPFMGSGTTGKMALLNNRKFVGIELSPDYVEIARKRIQECTK
jgi:site-specific DNA-methyltransferase (adenine-specific)